MIDRMPDDRELRFAFLIEPPFCYRAPDGAVTGCDVELARHVLREIGVRSFIPVETEFAELLSGLEDGRWEMTTGLFVTDERRKLADFSRPIWELPDGLLVRPDNPHRIDGYLSLARTSALRLGVVCDQVQHRTALRLGMREDHIEVFGAYAEAAAAVVAGAVDAFASVAMAHRGYLVQNAALPLAVVAVQSHEKTAEQGAFAFARSQERLRQAVDGALAGFLGSVDHRALMARFGFA